MILQKKNWCDEAFRALASLCYDDTPHAVAQNIERGKWELWLCDGQSWLVTELVDDETLWIWAYTGRDACAMVREVFSKGIRVARFNTLRPALQRLLKEFSPRLRATCRDTYTFEMRSAA